MYTFNYGTIYWFEKSASRDNVFALFNLASSISKVMDFKRTCPRVPSFLQKLRHSTLLLLSSIYYLGKGVDKDYSKAKRLFQQASAQGHNHALEFLLKVEKKEKINEPDSIFDFKLKAM